MKILTVGFFVAFITFVMGSPVAVAANAAAGKEKVKAVCAACHGQDGNSASAEFPKLAGQHEDYIVKSLKAYRSGERNAPVMMPMAKALTEEDIENVAAYFASQQSLVVYGYQRFR